ncbi:transcriptional regulator [Oceanococcus atlanticus]|uniref:Transcriptional regulator n=1 Tax=Oceanococcus atlanticus TaxID=1317117 RepID=A0A1Y1SE88_9GAMM|nr:YafY family protein [Oceanococcus atlanticus]ORE87316.1 transcriptional regulator [Oceanococcus atlanticus]RZO87065.1 MAG: YafY family transcriptional regulator [Oceanococcus sp.]
MDKFDRIYAMHRILSGRRTPISHEDLQQQLECSRATVTRTLELLRDHLNAPLLYDRERNGYIYAGEGRSWELPGLWLSSREVVALMAGIKFLGESGQGLLSEMVRPFRMRLEEILKQKHMGAGELLRRVKIVSTNTRDQGAYFQVVADATVRRKKLSLAYHSRSADEESLRTVSPQRLVNYRNNWYLDAWCHSREGLRTFSLDKIRSAQLSSEAARELPEHELDAQLAHSYGIFSGKPTAEADLLFSAHAARWVATETWHPEQRGEPLQDGRYRLRVPYAQSAELIGEILRYGPDVEVQGPADLRAAVRARLVDALAQYPD